MSENLPPLPPKRVINRHLPTGVALHGYDADDMRAYAVAAVAAARARSETAVAVLRQIAAARDCRTCAHHTYASGGCVSALRCVGGDRYQPTQPRQLWEQRPPKPAPF